MSPYKIIDLATWPRRKHFEFFQSFVAPAFNVTVSVNGETLYRYAKAHGESFFLLALYAILRGANAVPQVRQRLVDNQVLEFDRLSVLTPIMTPEELFQEVWCEYQATFAEFKRAALPDIERVKRGLPVPEVSGRTDFICASCVPWLHFDAITQADLTFGQDVPILAWGKMVDGKIPISVRFSHCFLDGLHVSRFFAAVEAGFAHPEQL